MSHDEPNDHAPATDDTRAPWPDELERRVFRHLLGQLPDDCWVPIEEVVPWEDNPRINDAAAERVADFIAEHGWTNPLLLRPGGLTLAGHTRTKAGALLNLRRLPRLLIEPDDDAEAIKLALFDNRANELAQWEDDQLQALLAEVVAADGGVDDVIAMGFDDDDLLAALVADPDDQATPADPSPAPAPAPLPAEPDSEVGEVYELGPHLLICGDSSTDAPWRSVPNHEVALVASDPPYGVSYATKAGKVHNDDLAPAALKKLLNKVFRRAIRACRPGAAWYVACAGGRRMVDVMLPLIGLGVFRHELIWLKDRFVLGRGDYHYKHEPILYGWEPSGPHHKVPDRKQSTVFEVPRPARNEDHPTMKPVALYERFINNSTRPGELVLDPFGGSGTTLLAAARTGRRAILVELSPAYCDVIRRRWTEWADAEGVPAGPGALRVEE